MTKNSGSFFRSSDNNIGSVDHSGVYGGKQVVKSKKPNDRIPIEDLTIEKVLEEASKYKNMACFKAGSPSAYKEAKARRWLDKTGLFKRGKKAKRILPPKGKEDQLPSKWFSYEEAKQVAMECIEKTNDETCALRMFVRLHNNVQICSSLNNWTKHFFPEFFAQADFVED
jgi:hypothetical protein